MTADPKVEGGGPPGRLFHHHAHLVSHTHWDREWYQPAGRFRQRLVTLIDELLDAPAREGAFLLDGQTIVLEDYLAVKPERAAELSAQLREGTLEAGPWYVLADELIPSGEALVRNLLAGRRMLKSLRAEAPPVLYCPDSFGHPSALPLIASGFGYQLIILWRGFGGARWPSSDVVRWRAPDGSAAIVYHLPPSGYEAGANLPLDANAASARWQQLHAALTSRNESGVILIPNGADHHARQSHLDEAVAALKSAAAPDTVLRSSLRAFSAALLAAVSQIPVRVITGELRDSYGYTWTLQGTFASRAAQKRRNALVEQLLARECEPFAAIAWRRGGKDRRSLLNAAWATLLRCHPHDTLCGCSTDEVAGAMDARLADASTQAHGLRQDAIAAIVGHDADAAHTQRDEWQPACVIWNAAPYPRSGIAEVELDTPLCRVPVGPGSQADGPPDIRRRPLSLGRDTPMQVLSKHVVTVRTESPRHYPVAEMTERSLALAWVSPIAGYGTSTRALGAGRATTNSPPNPVVATGLSLDNGALRVSVTALGTVRLEEIATGRTVESLISFEDVGDRGDLYTHSPVGDVSTDARFLGARLLQGGPLRGSIAVRWRLSLPRARPAVRATSRGESRAPRFPMPVTVTVSLDAGSPFVRIALHGSNTARDHRVRIVFDTGVSGGATHADAAFGTVHREPVVVPPEEARLELPPTTAPLHRYVSVFNSDEGATVYSDGLAEYEVTAHGGVAITLVRAVEQLSRNDLPERPGHAGWPEHTPDAQCRGPFEATFAIMLHRARGAESIDLIERVANDVLLPLRGATLRSAIQPSHSTRGVELSGAGLAFSAVKVSEDGESLVLRCVNLLDEQVTGEWHMETAITYAHLARLDETIVAPLLPEHDVVRFTAPPRAVVTILVRS